MNRRYFMIGAATLLRPAADTASANAASEDEPRFEVAAVRRVLRGSSIEMSPTVSGNRFLFEAAPLVAVLSFAYGVKLNQIAGNYPPPPGFLYRIEGVAPKTASREEFRAMLRTLLRQRFSLKARWEDREYSVRELIVDRKGLRIGAGASSAPGEGPGGKVVPDHMVANYGALVAPHAIARTVTMEQFATFLYDFVGEPVVDRTALTGLYSFELSWIQEDGATPSGPGMTLEEALPRTLGLSLKPGKARIRTLVVEHVSEPTEN